MQVLTSLFSGELNVDMLSTCLRAAVEKADVAAALDHAAATGRSKDAIEVARRNSSFSQHPRIAQSPTLVCNCLTRFSVYRVCVRITRSACTLLRGVRVTKWTRRGWFNSLCLRCTSMIPVPSFRILGQPSDYCSCVY